jgi:hypothetical protein
MRNSSLILILMALLPIGVACAASSERSASNVEAQIGRAAEMLATRVDADSQAAAGLLNVFKQPEQSLRHVAQAALKAPERADLAWLHMQLCLTDSSCDPEPLEARLRALDERNGAGWLGALGRASKRGDDEASSVALTAIARSERVDTYWTTLIARLTRPVLNTEAVSLFDAETYVIGALAGVAIPAYQSVSNACKGERLMRDDVVEACRGVAKSFLNGDTGITEMIGVAIAQRAWPENSPKWKEAAEARRIWEYRAQTLGSPDTWSRTRASELLAMYERHNREQDVIRAMLIAMGRDPNPPPIMGETAQMRVP